MENRPGLVEEGVCSVHNEDDKFLGVKRSFVVNRENRTRKLHVRSTVLA